MKPSKTKKNKKKKKPSFSHSSPPSTTNPPPRQAGNGGEAGDDDEDGNEDNAGLNWLIEAFASASIDEITSAYSEAEGDAYKAAGILASRLEGPGEGGEGVTVLGSAGFVDSKETGKGIPRRIQRPKRVVAAASGMVSNVIGKGYSNECKRRSEAGFGAEGKGLATMNRTYSAEEAEEFLCSLLGNESELGLGVVKDVLGQCGCNIGKYLLATSSVQVLILNSLSTPLHDSSIPIYFEQFDERGLKKALNVLLDISASSFSSLKGGICTDSDKFRRIISGICPEISSNEFSKNIISSVQLTDNTSESTYHPSEKVNTFPPHVGYGSREQLLVKPDLIKPDIQQKVLESLFNTPDHQTYEPNCMHWKKVVKKVESFGQGLEFRSSSSSDTQSDASDGKEDMYEVLRSASRKNWDTMRTYYQKAALAYSRGHRAHASNLSEKGRLYRDLAREADEKASRDIFEARNKEIKNTVTIDLHGQHVKQAIGLVKLHLMLFSYIPSVQFLKVITGCGTDGVGKGKLKCSVLALVEKEGIEHIEENVGTLILRLDRQKVYSFMECDGASE